MEAGLGDGSSDVRGEFLSVCKRDLIEAHQSLAVLGAVSVNRDFITRLHRVSLPIDSGQHAQAGKFGGPFDDGAFVVFGLNGDVRVRIAPLEFRDGAFHGG